MRIIILSMLCVIVYSCGRMKFYNDEFESYPQEQTVYGSCALKNFPSSFLLQNYQLSGDPGKSSGRTYSVLIDYSDSSHWLAGSANGGVWASYNSGNNWQALNDKMICPDVRCIIQNPFSPSVFYYSSDARLTDSTGQLIPDIFRSTDGGLSFQELPHGNFNPSGTKKIICSPVDSNIIYGYSRESASSGIPWYLEQVFRSTDAGNSFQPLFIFNSPFRVKELLVLPNGAVIFSSLNDLYYSATGDSGTFTLISNPFGLGASPQISRIYMDFCVNSPNVVYAYIVAGSTKRIYKSTDSGLTWNNMFDLATLSTGWSVLFGAIGVKPDNPDYVVVGDVSLAYSHDGGNTFQKFSGITGPDYHCVTFDPFNFNRLIVTNDHDVSFLDLTLAPQTPFSSRNYNMFTSLNHAGDYYYSGNSMILGRNDYGVQRNVGQATIPVSGGDGTYCFIHKQDTNVGYITNQNARLLRYDNIYTLSGANSILNQLDTNNDFQADDGVMFIHPFEMNQADGDQLYFPTHKWLWRSNDRGDNWEKITNQLGFSSDVSVGLSIGNSTDPLACLVLDDTIWIKPNAATSPPGNEFPLPAGDTVRNVFVVQNNDSVLYVTFRNAPRKVARCDNVFASNPVWSGLSGNLPASVRPTCLIVHPEDANFIIAGSGNGIFISTDGGQNWTHEENMPYVLISQLRLRRSDLKLFIYTWGRGVWTADLPRLSTGVKGMTDSDFRFFPIPFNDKLYMQKPNDYNSSVSRIIFYNCTGSLVHSAIISANDPLIIDTQSWNAGIYFYSVIMQEKKIFSGRVIKLN